MGGGAGSGGGLGGGGGNGERSKLGSGWLGSGGGLVSGGDGCSDGNGLGDSGGCGLNSNCGGGRDGGDCCCGNTASCAEITGATIRLAPVAGGSEAEARAVLSESKKEGEDAALEIDTTMVIAASADNDRIEMATMRLPPWSRWRLPLEAAVTEVTAKALAGTSRVVERADMNAACAAWVNITKVYPWMLMDAVTMYNPSGAAVTKDAGDPRSLLRTPKPTPRPTPMATTMKANTSQYRQYRLLGVEEAIVEILT